MVGTGLLVPEVDVAPFDGDRALAAGRAVRAELVVEAAAGALLGALERAVDVRAVALAHLVRRVGAPRGSDGRAAGNGVAAVDRVQPAALLDGQQEERAGRLEGLL